MASGHTAVKRLLSHPCHIYYLPENCSSNQLDTSPGKGEQDQLSRCILRRHFNRSVIHSTLFSACAPYPAAFPLKFKAFWERVHMSASFYNTYCNTQRQHSPQVFFRTKSFQPPVSASTNGDDWAAIKAEKEVQKGTLDVCSETHLGSDPGRQ